MRLFLVRHGQTDWNLLNRFQGSSDVPMNEEGLTQARNIARRLADTPFAAAYTSPLSRAKDTAIAIIGGRDIPLYEDDSLLEVRMGIWEGQLMPEMAKAYPEQWWFYEHKPSELRVPEADILPERVAECAAFIKKLWEKYPDDDVLITSHGYGLRFVIAGFFGLDVDSVGMYTFANCSLSIIGGNSPDGRLRIRTLNDNTHNA